MGDPLDERTTLGPMAQTRQMNELKQQVKVATERDGASIIYGRTDFIMEKRGLEDGNWFGPVVTEGMNTNSKSFQTEFFGPVFNLFSAPTSKECLDLANNSDFGLAGTIFTENLDLAENYATKLRVGSVTVNDIMFSYSDLPSGGIKQSGFGRECYKDGLMEIAYRKSIVGKNW